mmetsp:Transcript_17825/g.44948  ORF Transcript_17825/g.44948 Transcript_17825/m.44948 type:complete len:248 (-) Transcript_17825:1126-1869(-)
MSKIHRASRVTLMAALLLSLAVGADGEQQGGGCEIVVRHSPDARETCRERLDGARLECATYVEGQSLVQTHLKGGEGLDGAPVWRAEAADPGALFHCRMVGGGLSPVEEQSLTNLQCGATIGCSRETLPIEVSVEHTDSFEAWGQGLLQQQLAGALGGDVQVSREWEVFPGRRTPGTHPSMWRGAGVLARVEVSLVGGQHGDAVLGVLSEGALMPPTDVQHCHNGDCRRLRCMVIKGNQLCLPGGDP